MPPHVPALSEPETVEIDMVVEEIFGFTISTRCRLSADPLEFRRRQSDLVAHLRAGTGHVAVVPESYCEPAGADRQSEQVMLRTWSDESVGVTRYPAGLVRIIVPSDEERAGWRLGRRVVTIFRDGTAVVRADWQRGAAAPQDVPGHVAALGARTVSSDVATALMVELDALVAEAMAATSMPHLRLGSVAVVGRHRLVRIGTEPSDAFLDQARDQIALVGSNDDFTDLSAKTDLFLHAGNGISLEISRDATTAPSRLIGPLTEYEHWISVACRTDDELAEEFRHLSNLTQPHRGPVGTTWERAQLALFDHQDVLNAMSPEHSAAWRGYMATWRLPDLEDEIRLKLDAVRDRDRELRETMSNQIATRTDQTITFLTTLTLVSIVTGVATYLINEPRPGVGWRLVLVALTVVVATVIYQRSAYPGRLHQAVVRLERRLTRIRTRGRVDG